FVAFCPVASSRCGEGLLIFIDLGLLDLWRK
ncbi:hypothetical protein A2U01_0050109, partial [Trifolium medium]|nr:hypothetical protein [Trifolium medium]